MANTTITYEEGVDGAQIPASLAGQWDAANVDAKHTYSSEHPAHGSMGSKLTNPGTSTLGQRRGISTPDAKLEIVGYFWLSVLPGSDLFLQRGFYTGDVGGPFFSISTGNKLRLGVPGNSNVFTATPDFPVAQIVRCGIYMEASTDGTNGKARVAYFLGDSTTPVVDSGLITGLNTAASTGLFMNARWGKQNGNAYAGNIHWDTMRILTNTDATNTFAPFVSNIAPVANAGPDQLSLEPGRMITIGGTDTDSDGTIASRVWTQVSGPSILSLLSSTSAASPTLRIPRTATGGNAVLRKTVTDNAGATSTDDVTIGFLGASSWVKVDGILVPSYEIVKAS